MVNKYLNYWTETTNLTANSFFSSNFEQAADLKMVTRQHRPLAWLQKLCLLMTYFSLPAFLLKVGLLALPLQQKHFAQHSLKLSPHFNQRHRCIYYHKCMQIAED